MKAASFIKRYMAIGSRSQFATVAFTGGALAYSNEVFRDKLKHLLAAQPNCSLCDTAEQQAADLDKILRESGGMLSQEELVDMMMKKKNTL